MCGDCARPCAAGADQTPLKSAFQVWTTKGPSSMPEALALIQSCCVPLVMFMVNGNGLPQRNWSFQLVLIGVPSSAPGALARR